MTTLDAGVLPGETFTVNEEPSMMPDHDHDDHDVSMEAPVNGFTKEEEGEGEGEGAPRQEVEEEEEEENVAMEDDLFGEEDAAAGSTKPTSTVGSAVAGDDGLSDSERQRRRELEYEEPDDEPEDQVFEEVIEAAIAIPNVPLPKSSDGQVSLKFQ
jgi:RNA polymerase-associated protein LEO1